MKKIILATAITAFSASAFAGHAERENKPPIGVYGYLNLTYQQTSYDAPWAEDGGDFYDNGSTLGFYGEHEVAPGVTGFARIEVESTGLTNDFKNVELYADEVYVGVKGRYGQVLVGKDDSLMEVKVDRIAQFYETNGLHAPFAQYNRNENDRVIYESALLPSYGGGLLQFSASVNRSDVIEIDLNNKEIKGQKFDYELGVSHATDRFEIAGVVSSNKNTYFDGKDSGNHSIGIFGSAKVTDDLLLSANFIHNEGNSDLPYDRYYSVMTNYTKGKFKYTVSYANSEIKYGDGFSNGWDSFSGQIGYAATENLFLYAEASVGDYVEVEDFGMTETFKGTSTAVGVVYSF